MIELMVVIFVIGLLGMLVVPRMGIVSDFELKSSANKIVSLFRLAYDSAIMTNKVYRVFYDFENNKITIGYLDVDEAEPVKSDDTKNTEVAKDSDQDTIESKLIFQGKFVDDETMEVDLPSGIKLDRVVTAHSDVPVDKGFEFTLFFTNGFVEKTFIYLKDTSDDIYTITVNPLTGNATIHPEEISYEEK